MTLAETAAATGSSSVVILEDGEPIFEWTDEGGPRPIHTMSATKMVVGVGVGLAVAEQGPEVLDESIATWLTEWADDARAKITLKDLLQHKSGLHAPPPTEIDQAPSVVAMALAAELVREPGESWGYNNLAMNLLGEIARRASGLSINKLMDDRLFRPLEFDAWNWPSDPSGHPFCHAGLQVAGIDLAKIGQLLLDSGRELVAPWWAEAMGRRGLATMAQSAWARATLTEDVVDTWRAAGVDEDIVGKLMPLQDRTLDLDDFVAARDQLVGNDLARVGAQIIGRGLRFAEFENGPVVGYGHDGDLGQRLVVMPDIKRVAVRQREWGRSGSSWSAFPGDAADFSSPAPSR